MAERLILIVDDEKPIVDILKFNLQKEGFDTIEAYDGATGLQLAMEKNPDLILLDVMLPEMDGFTVCKEIRVKSQVPIILLTAREEEVDKVLGLELGADDYITKPYSVRELLARIKANLRRTKKTQPVVTADNTDLLTYGRLTIDTERFEVKKDGKPVEITVREFELLKFLASQPDKIFSREKLLEKVWKYEYYGDLRTVDVTVRRLREKLEDNPGEPDFVVTKRGIGYYFNKNCK
ncbi:MAG: response regulator transcription factor [Ruminococcaceae bacterium]|nr:response regulator transcription factor [Oscillospiraceae bacterium]